MSSIGPNGVAGEFTGSMAWHAQDLREPQWCFDLGSDVLAELDHAVCRHRRSRLAVIAQRPEDFALNATRELGARLREGLRRGRGFVLLRGMPVEDWGADGCTLAYWLVASLIARPVAQDMAGTLVYDVRDTGRKPEPGSGVRPDKTNVEQYFHNDNAYNRCQPDYVGLLCIRPAAEGGRSGVASIRTLHNAMRSRHPDALRRLYEPFFFDRQKEHPPGEVELVSAPVFARDGDELKMRMGLYPLLNAYKLPGMTLDAPGAEALEALKEVLADPSLCHSFSMRAGEVQFVNNLGTCHRRTAFADDPATPRHLVRLWLRDAGDRGYDGGD